jgi:hypothetical protein
MPLAHVADVLVGVGEAELHRLDLQVLAERAVDRQRAEVEMAGDAEGDQRGDALAVGRDLVQAMAPGVDADRVDPLGLERGEVARGHRAAVGRRVPGRGFGDLAAVEGGAARLGDRLQALRRGAELEALAHLRRPALGQEGLGPARLALEQRRRRDPLLLHDDRHRIAALAGLDRRRQQVGEGQLAEALGQGDPAGHGARHGHRVPAALRRLAGVGAVLAPESTPESRRPAPGPRR